MQPSVMDFLSNYMWQNREERPNWFTNIWDVDEKAKHTVSEGVNNLMNTINTYDRAGSLKSYQVVYFLNFFNKLLLSCFFHRIKPSLLYHKTNTLKLTEKNIKTHFGTISCFALGAQIPPPHYFFWKQGEWRL